MRIKLIRERRARKPVMRAVNGVAYIVNPARDCAQLHRALVVSDVAQNVRGGLGHIPDVPQPVLGISEHLQIRIADVYQMLEFNVVLYVVERDFV